MYLLALYDTAKLRKPEISKKKISEKDIYVYNAYKSYFFQISFCFFQCVYMQTYHKNK